MQSLLRHAANAWIALMLIAAAAALDGRAAERLPNAAAAAAGPIAQSS